MTDPTIEAYNEFANIYDQEVINFWDNFPKEFIDQFIKITPGKKTLNFGSGSGRDALLLRDKGLEVTCLDGSYAMTDITHNLGFKTILSTFEDANFPAESFDGVWAYTSLLHQTKPEMVKTLKRFYGWLRPGGTLGLGMIKGKSEGFIERKSMPNTKRYFIFYTSDELNQIVEMCGFKLQTEQEYQPHKKIYLNKLFIR